MSKIEYSFVVPVYNEKENIVSFLEEISKIFDKFSKNYEIIFVDDNSPDGTANEVINLSKKYKRIRLLQHGKREGLGAAIMYGYENTQGNIIIGIDVDLSQSPTYLFSMIKKIEKGYDMVIGSRYLTNSKIINKKFIRKFGSIFVNWTASYLLNIKLSDSSHTFRIFKKKILKHIKPYIKEKSHPSFLIEFTFWANKNFLATEVPMTFIERDISKGTSKLSINEGILHFFKTVLILYFQK